VSANIKAQKLILSFFRKIIQEGSYTPQEIRNVDETLLFWGKMPDSTYISKENDNARIQSSGSIAKAFT
jgi:hypothetical protein